MIISLIEWSLRNRLLVLLLSVGIARYMPAQHHAAHEKQQAKSQSQNDSRQHASLQHRIG